jgi:MoaA/NifB/PqqE/SkfB family radical SAM enzyme
MVITTETTDNTKTRDDLEVQKGATLPVTTNFNTSLNIVSGWQRIWLACRVRGTILKIALQCYGSFSKAFKAARSLQAFKKSVEANTSLKRCVKIEGKYYFGIYIPAYPSAIFNRFVATELNRMLPHHQPVNKMQVVQIAITNKCPMKCEHCFEWNNLNQKETFTSDELKQIIAAFQAEGCTQFHFTGGEPLVQMNKLEELIGFTSRSSECWVLTSGLNLSVENATRLKNAGATGVVISLDHYDAEMHNLFRGNAHAFENVMIAVEHANRVKLVTAFSICLTRSFVSEKNLMKYAGLAKDCGVSFVQLLEPKAVGHYEGKQVTLSKEHFDLLDSFYGKINFNKLFKDYPVYIYHGHYQRKIGCLSGGKWVLYIDSAGFIDACPFCQTKSYDARDMLSGKLTPGKIQLGGCPSYPGKQEGNKRTNF